MKICEEYLDGASSIELGKKYSMTPTSICRFLKEYGIEARSNKINSQVSFSGTEDVFHISNYLFQDATIFLNRKKKRYLDILDAHSRLLEKSERLSLG